MLMTDLTTECPEPGVYEDVPFNDYVNWRAISNSQLSLLKKSPQGSAGHGAARHGLAWHGSARHGLATQDKDLKKR